jgi:hypothetical protein
LLSLIKQNWPSSAAKEVIDCARLVGPGRDPHHVDWARLHRRVYDESADRALPMDCVSIRRRHHGKFSETPDSSSTNKGGSQEEGRKPKSANDERELRETVNGEDDVFPLAFARNVFTVDF